MDEKNIYLEQYGKMPEKKVYSGIDTIKLVCSVLIVYMHTYCWDTGSFGLWVRDEVASIAVPFFFISSGYFYGIGIRCSEDKKGYFFHYFVRVLKMYIIWTVFSLPAAWYNISMAHGEYSMIMKLFYLIRSFFFTGSIGVYWYLLSLIYNSVILYLVYTKKMEKVMYFLAVIFFAIGVLNAASLLSGTMVEKLIHYAFGSERNFLNVGLFYMVIGYFLSDKVIEVKRSTAMIGFILLLGVQTIVNSTISVRFVHAFTAVALFIWAHQMEMTAIQSFSKKIRKLSTAIYLIHFPFILLFDFYLCKGTLVDFSSTLIFVIVLYLVTSRVLPKKWVSIIYGN